MNTVSKYLNRTKLQVAILAVLLVIANKYFSLGLDQGQLTLAVYGLIAYIGGESLADAFAGWRGATKQPPSS